MKNKQKRQSCKRNTRNRLEVIERFQHKEMKNAWNDGYALKWPDHYTLYVLKHHYVPHKYVQLLLVKWKNKNNNQKDKVASEGK